MKAKTSKRLLELVDCQAPALVLAVDELDQAQAEFVFLTIGSAAAHVLSDVWQRRIDRDA